MNHLESHFSPELLVSWQLHVHYGADCYCSLFASLQGHYPRLFKMCPPMIGAATMLLAFDSSIFEGSFQHKGLGSSPYIPSNWI